MLGRPGGSRAGTVNIVGPASRTVLYLVSSSGFYLGNKSIS